MARNQEKAQSMLNRYLQGKKDECRAPKQHRPYIASTVNDIAQADKWRYQIVKEIAQKVGEIQNSALEDHTIRELNDTINQLLKEKQRYDRRIADLGTQNHKTLEREKNSLPREVDFEYRYFGAARNLPAAKDLSEKQASSSIEKKTTLKTFQHMSADYYGLCDEDDEDIVPAELDAELKMMQEEVCRQQEEKRL